ncbi:hypothetical protein ACH42_10560 [Endozoicomonas sp. (ex Bugula neritina AB1)]|nr:hypothetical protein ACH42_10560 [Endozoicomonas sp. (ex Bugula neritina AB1)]
MNAPVLLAVELSSRSFLYCRLLHPDRHTLPSLNRWYSKLYEAIFLIQLGDLHYLQGKKVSALNRDWGEPWVDVQPRLSPSRKHLKSIARSLKITTIYVNQQQTWVVDTIA